MSEDDKNQGSLHARFTTTDDGRMNIRSGYQIETEGPALAARDQTLDMIAFLEGLGDEIEGSADLFAPNPVFRMALYLLRAHIEGKIVTPTALIGASRVPYATASRRLADMTKAGLIERRTRTASGKSVSLHPSETLIEQWMSLAGRVRRQIETRFGDQAKAPNSQDYFYGGSYMATRSIAPLQVLSEPLKPQGGLRVLVHGDPTFMVMVNLKRRFEQVVGCPIHQRAFSIDRLRDEGLRNAARKTSRYDIIAVDLPWMGEFAQKGILIPLDEVMDVARLDPPDFHTAGWCGIHWKGRPYGVPAQMTPELFFYRRDLFAEAGLTPPTTTDSVLQAARQFHKPRRGRYGIAWNAARGTALGHTVLMTIADFGQPVLDLPKIAGGFDTSGLADRSYRAVFDTDAARAACEYLLELLSFSPPDILSMSWYERVRPYASGAVPMAYGYTLLAPYFERDETSPACGKTGYLPHPAGPGANAVAPVGGYVMGIPANLPAERLRAAAEALVVFASPEAQKMYAQNGSRTNPRYSVAADPEVRRLSPIFEAVDEMSLRDELQFWPRPPIPEICDLTQICGEEFHDMLRGIHTPAETLVRTQARADDLLKPSH